jgi:nitroreductase/dihydropteridine reductase
MKITDLLNWRYSTKEFDPNKKITAEDFEQIKALLQMSSSSTNLQPWHFVIANNDESKKRITKGTQGFFQFNEAKVLNASHVIVFCAKTDIKHEYMLRIQEQEDKDGRYMNEDIKQKIYAARNIFSNIHRYDLKDLQHWFEKQVYLNMGNLLLGAAALRIDALPMEGLDMKAIDEEFSLREKGFTAVAVVSLGYRSANDFNTPDKTPKSRLPQDEIFTIL